MTTASPLRRPGSIAAVRRLPVAAPAPGKPRVHQGRSSRLWYVGQGSSKYHASGSRWGYRSWAEAMAAALLLDGEVAA